jgi:predicted nuclease of predicted toxin-antitoxin system
MKRIIPDQGLSPLAAMLLRAEGWDVLHVLDVRLERAEDAEILDFALRESRTCVTLDHDFHSHLARNRTTGPSVVFVRLEGMAGREQADLIRKNMERLRGRYRGGCSGWPCQDLNLHSEFYAAKSSTPTFQEALLTSEARSRMAAPNQCMPDQSRVSRFSNHGILRLRA